MGTGADQAKWLRQRLTLARGKRGDPNFIPLREVAGRIADILKHTPAWKKAKRVSLTKQAVSLWEKDEVQPGVDELAASARAVNLRLWVDVYDPADKTIETRIRADLLRLVHEMELLKPDDLAMVRDLIMRLRKPMPGEEDESPEEE